MSGLRSRFAILIGRSVLRMLRASGRKGTTLPGSLALRVDPELLRYFGEQLSGKVILITGTNGKTTTANLLTTLLKQEGLDVIHNTLGANLLSGITTTLLDGFRRSKNQVAVLEVDEATIRHIVPKLKPTGMIVTNFFRDQMDRYGEVNTVIELVSEAIQRAPSSMKLILNADDPLVASLGTSYPSVIWYGIGQSDESTYDEEDVRDGRHCLSCGAPLVYRQVRYGGLGDYHCSNCEFERPTLSVSIDQVEMCEDTISFQVWGMEGALSSKALYNVYNAGAAIIGASLMGVSHETLQQGMKLMQTGLGRMETFTIDGRKVVLALVKNPTGFNQALRVVETEPEVDLQLILNDAYADGTDVSWIWDTNLERLMGRPTVRKLVSSGVRPYDMAVRLKYAGWSESIEVIPGDVEAVKQLVGDNRQRPLYILSTYTSLYNVRDYLVSIKGGAVGANV